MTKEEKAKAYDEALNKLRRYMAQGVDPLITRADVQDFFPELKESEDERTRKYLISFVKLNSGVNLPPEDAEQILAWLEKQKTSEEALQYLRENHSSSEMSDFQAAMNIAVAKAYDKGYNDGLEKQGEQKPIDKVETKFKNGQWIVWRDKCYKVNYNGCGYELVDQDGLSTSLEYATIDENAHIWNATTDTKDGDVLHSPTHNLIWIHKDIQHYHACVNMNYVKENFSTDGFIVTPTDVCPATKDKQTILFAKMKEAGYEWDFEKKEPKKIEQKPTDNDMKEPLHTEYEKGRADAIAEMQKPVDCTDCTNSKGCINCKNGDMKETLVRKPAWSEEDESYLNTTIAYLKDAKEFKKSAENCINWLKSLNERVQPKEELSEENARLLDNCISLIEDIPCTENEQNWLKSLKDRYTWKPSDEQMEVLLSEVSAWTKGCPKQIVLESLYNDLKKLTEE